MQPCEALRDATYLIRQHIRPEVSERQLQLLEAVVDGNLDGDQRILSDIVGVVSRRRHVDEGCLPAARRVW